MPDGSQGGGQIRQVSGDRVVFLVVSTSGHMMGQIVVGCQCSLIVNIGRFFYGKANNLSNDPLDVHGEGYPRMLISRENGEVYVLTPSMPRWPCVLCLGGKAGWFDKRVI